MNHSKSQSKVSVINFNLHKKYLIEEQPDPIQQSFSDDSFKKSQSPKHALKRLIIKGIDNCVKPLIRKELIEKSHLRNSLVEKFLLEQPQHQYCSTMQNCSSAQSRLDPPQSIHRCSRGNRININSKLRIKTEFKQNYPKKFYLKRNSKKGQEQILPLKHLIFEEFKSISEQNFRLFNIQNIRRNRKINQIHKLKYNEVWKKHTIPSLFFKINSKIYSKNL